MQLPYSWSPDGKFLAFSQLSLESGWEIWIPPLEGDEKSGWKPGKPRIFLDTHAGGSSPAFSPDGHWVAYESIETGTPEMYVRPFPGPGGKWQISRGGGLVPVWSRNGNKLFFRTPQDPAWMMVANYQVVGNSFQADKPAVWSQGTFVGGSGLASGWSFDLDLDGKHFVVFRPREAQGNAERNDKFVLILNVFDELRRAISGSR